MEEFKGSDGRLLTGKIFIEREIRELADKIIAGEIEDELVHNLVYTCQWLRESRQRHMGNTLKMADVAMDAMGVKK